MISFLSSAAEKRKSAKGIKISHTVRGIGAVENILFPKG
jgi:hypothetical protein